MSNTFHDQAKAVKVLDAQPAGTCWVSNHDLVLKRDDGEWHVLGSDGNSYSVQPDSIAWIMAANETPWAFH